MFKKLTPWILVMALLVTAPLLWFSWRPLYLVEVLIQPTSEARGQILVRQILTKADGNGVVFFDFRALVGSDVGEFLFLEIRPAAEAKFYRQGDGYRVVDRIVSGVAQLGHPDWPVHQDEKYTFRLVATGGIPLLDGTILAKAHPISGTSPWVLAAIGLLASVIEILRALWLPTPKPAEK